MGRRTHTRFTVSCYRAIKINLIHTPIKVKLVLCCLKTYKWIMSFLFSLSLFLDFSLFFHTPSFILLLTTFLSFMKNILEKILLNGKFIQYYEKFVMENVLYRKHRYDYELKGKNEARVVFYTLVILKIHRDTMENVQFYKT